MDWVDPLVTLEIPVGTVLPGEVASRFFAGQTAQQRVAALPYSIPVPRIRSSSHDLVDGVATYYATFNPPNISPALRDTSIRWKVEYRGRVRAIQKQQSPPTRNIAESQDAWGVREYDNPPWWPADGRSFAFGDLFIDRLAVPFKYCRIRMPRVISSTLSNPRGATVSEEIDLIEPGSVVSVETISVDGFPQQTNVLVLAVQYSGGARQAPHKTIYGVSLDISPNITQVWQGPLGTIPITRVEGDRPSDFTSDFTGDFN